MVKHMTLVATFLIALGATAADPKTDAAKAKKGLQEIGEFIGQWNLAPDAKFSGKGATKETLEFGWKFKGDDSWIALTAKDSKHVPGGKLRFDPEKKKYSLTATGKDGKEAVYTGEFKKGKLVVESKDTSGDVTRLTFNTLAEGVRLALLVESQKGGSGPFETVYKAAGTKEGETFAGGAAAKKNECVVTGGTGTMQVTYMGKSYWVCCSGCRDEFNANPKKYVEAAEKAKK